MLPIIGQLASLVSVPDDVGTRLHRIRKATAVDAIKKVFELTKSGEFTVPLVFAVIASLVGGLGAVACGIGVFFTLPLTYCLMACCCKRGNQQESKGPLKKGPFFV
jgi:hypothetical protein